MYIQLFAVLVTYKINLFIARLTNCNCVSPAQQFHKHNIFEDQVNISHIAAKNSFTNTVICDIILFISGKNLFTLQLLSLYLIEQVGITTISNIVQDGFRSNRALLAFKEFGE